MSELKPCPFCGQPGVIKTSWLSNNWYAPGCTDYNCPAYNPEQDEQGGFNCEFALEEEAVEEWNTRPIEDELRSRVEDQAEAMRDIMVVNHQLIKEMEGKDTELTRLREQVRWIPKNEGIPADPSLVVEVYTQSGNFEYRKVYDITAAVAYWRYRQPPEEVNHE